MQTIPVAIHAPQNLAVSTKRRGNVISIIFNPLGPEIMQFKQDEISLNYVRACRDFELAKGRNGEGNDGAR